MDLRRRWPPVLAGIVIGSSAVVAYVTAGRGIGASGAITRFVAVVQHWLFPAVTEQSPYFSRYFAHGQNPLDNYLVYLMLGLLLGSFVGGLMARDVRIEVLRGPNISVAARLSLALLGGVLVGFAARLARGCTSGLGLVGSSELSVGAWAFLACVFIGGYGAAYFVRRQWL